jgi:hypothetical protein
MHRFYMISFVLLLIAGIPEHAAAQATPALCERVFKAETNKITSDYLAQLRALAANDKTAEIALQAQLDQADARLVAATKSLQNPGGGARAKRDDLCKPILSSVQAQSKIIRQLISERKSDLPDAEWDVLTAKIDSAQAARDGKYRDYQSCLVTNAVTSTTAEALQDEFNAASAASAKMQNRLTAQKAKTRAAQDTLKADQNAELDLAARRRDQCLISGDVFTGGDMLPPDCRCALAIALSELERAMVASKAQRAALKNATQSYRDTTNALVETLAARAAVLSEKNNTAARDKYINLLTAFASGGVRLAGLKLSRDAGALLKAIEADGNTVVLAGKIKTMVEVNEARSALAAGLNIVNNNRKFYGAYAKVLNDVLGDGTSAELAAIEAAVQAEGDMVKIVAELSATTALRERLWQSFMDIECVRKSCGYAVDDIGLFGTGKADRKRFVAAAFGPSAPAKRLALADCASCKAIALVLELKGYSDVAGQNVLALEQNIVSNQKALMALLGDKTNFLSRDLAFGGAGGTAVKLGLPIMSLAAVVKSPLVPAAVAGEMAVSVARYFETGIKSDLDANLSGTITLVRGNLEENLASLIYWQRYAVKLDRQLIDALGQLGECLQSKCSQTQDVSITPDVVAPAKLPARPPFTTGKTIGGIPVLTLPTGDSPLPDCTGIFEPGKIYEPEEAAARGSMVEECVAELNAALASLYDNKSIEFGAATETEGVAKDAVKVTRPDCPFIYIPGIDYTPEVIKQRTAMVRACITAGGAHDN